MNFFSEKLFGWPFRKNAILTGEKRRVEQLNYQDRVYGMIFGSCVGDALGVPVEFHSRMSLHHHPVRGMIGYGTWSQPPGTWSDDSSMMFCTMDALIEGYDIQRIANRFIRWYQEALWTPYGEVFDIGNTTKMALDRLLFGNVSPKNRGLSDEYSNGNGSLMRILPVAPLVSHMPFTERSRIVREVSSITHSHERSILACIILVELACFLIQGYSCSVSYKMTQDIIRDQFGKRLELTRFPLIFSDIREKRKESIESGGYVIHTLEAAIWCLLRHDSYADVVLEAVNLGGDTDTTAMVAGGLAGLAFGYKNISQEWINQLANKENIHSLADSFTCSMGNRRLLPL